MMIYPIFDKKISDEFFFTFYYLFKRILIRHEIYLIIGYSFRDPSINDALYSGLKSNVNTRMIVSATNQKVIDRIESAFSEVRDQLEVIRIRFGNHGFIEKLEELLI
jgi:hypothetical protein